MPTRQASEGWNDKDTKVFDTSKYFRYMCKNILLPLIFAHMKKHQCDCQQIPVVFFGHSLGALVAFEVAHHMELGWTKEWGDKQFPCPRLHLVLSSAKSPMDLHIFNSDPSNQFYHNFSNEMLFSHVKNIGIYQCLYGYN